MKIKTADRTLERNVRALKRQGWTDAQIASYKRGWYEVGRRIKVLDHE